MPFDIPSENLQVLVAFGCYLLGVVSLGLISHRYLKKGEFVKEYFIGNRGLGPWVLAFTVAGTAISGGSFMGFPALIYTNGWIMALWISSYMVVPLTALILMGKRLNQVSRMTGAVTVSDIFRDRFRSPTLGLLSTLLILGFLSVNLIAQFKAAGLVMKEALHLPAGDVELPILGQAIDRGYLYGLLIFAFTVVAYTTYGGFWAVAWTDVLEGTVKLLGVMLMAFLAISAVPAIGGKTGLAAATEHLRLQDPNLVTGPGPGNFLPLGMAFSFFLMWSMTTPGQPHSMVRLMSFKDAPSLSRSLLLVCVYYVITYGSLLVIFICARAIFPTEYVKGTGTLGQPDSIMPAMALKVAPPLIAGMLLAAPYAAIMSSVAAFLLMISSSLVRDIYQRTINPEVTPRVIKAASYFATALVGVCVMIGALHPPDFLQYIIVFTSTGLACAFLIPMLMLLYWRRATRAGVLAAMVGGLLTVLLLYVGGWTDTLSRDAIARYQRDGAGAPPVVARWLQDHLQWISGWGEKRPTSLAPLYLGGVDTLIWGFLASIVLGIGVSLATRDDPSMMKRYFPSAEST
jgi:SSS family solute:Na+ symporter/sodium/pantothenate symporter